jgi:hypothetical protein
MFDCLSIVLDELGPAHGRIEYHRTDRCVEDMMKQKFPVLGFIPFSPAAITNMIRIAARSSDTAIRRIDDNSWGVEAWCETISSMAVVVKIVADQAKKDAQPVSKVCIAVASVGCAFTDTESVFRFAKCIERCFKPPSK